MTIRLPSIPRMIRICRRLRRWLKTPGKVPTWQIDCAFALPRLLVERLRLSDADADERSYFRNQVHSSRRHAEDGERESARYPLRDLGRKLATQLAS